MTCRGFLPPKILGKEADARGVTFLNNTEILEKTEGLPTGRIADLVKNWSSPNTDMVIDDGMDNDGIQNQI